MKEATFDPARRLDLYFRCNRAGSKDFILTYSDGSPYSFIYEEFQFNIYRYEGEKKIFLQLLSFSNQDTFTAQITKAQANIDEAEYYYEIYNTQTEETWLCGSAFFHNGKFDGVSTDTSDVTIQINGDLINITLEVTPPALSFAAINQNANLVYAGPATGAASAPTFRALVAADLGSGANGTKFLRDDMTWQTISSGSSLTATQVGFGDVSNALSGNANFTFDSTNLALTVNGIRIGKMPGLTANAGLYIGNGAGVQATWVTSDGRNTAIGTLALSSMINGSSSSDSSYNFAGGYRAAQSLTIGSRNVVIGHDTARLGTTFSACTIIGANSASTAILTGVSNTFYGYGIALGATSAFENTIIGNSAGQGLTTGSRNTIVGNIAGQSLTTGSQNTLGGSESFEYLQTHSNNTSWGYWAAVYQIGNNNTAIGAWAFGQVAVVPTLGVTTLTESVALGVMAGDDGGFGAAVVNGAGLTFLGSFTGYLTGVSSAGLSNAAAIGYKSRVGQSASMVFGGTADANRVNFGFGGESYASGLGGVYVKNAITNPSGNPTNGFILYSDGGVAKILNASGVAFTIGSGGGWATTGTTTLTGASIVVGSSSNTLAFKFDNIGATGSQVLTFQNTQAATNGAQQDMQFHLEGRGFATGVNNSQSVIWRFRNLPVQAATNPTASLVISSSINGGGYSNAMTFTTADTTLTTPNLHVSSGSLTLSATRSIFFNGGTGTIAADSESQLHFRGNLTTTAITQFRFSNVSGAYSATSGTQNVIGLEVPFAPTSGTAIFNGFNVTGVINQTGGSNGAVSIFNISPTYTAAGGDVMGFYYNPTVTSITGVHYCFRATSGNMLIGGTTLTTNAILDLQSTSKAFIAPRMTTAQKAAIGSPSEGMMVYDTDLDKYCHYSAATTSWLTMTSA